MSAGLMRKVGTGEQVVREGQVTRGKGVTAGQEGVAGCGNEKGEKV